MKSFYQSCFYFPVTDVNYRKRADLLRLMIGYALSDDTTDLGGYPHRTALAEAADLYSEGPQPLSDIGRNGVGYPTYRSRNQRAGPFAQVACSSVYACRFDPLQPIARCSTVDGTADHSAYDRRKGKTQPPG
ncbi:hypothetical protein ABIA39_006236 [Nocardia sp. GAS34]|uniref:hypothetical protein n=1 Tax=Nocardia sp. GAS34 TaxID=3156305 RepID=UPI003D23596D